MGALRVAHSSAGWWGQGQKALPPLCTGHTEAQGGGGGREESRQEAMKSMGVHKTNLSSARFPVSLPGRLKNPKSPRRQRNQRGHWAARCASYPGSQRFASVWLPAVPWHSRSWGVRGSAASRARVWPQIFKALPGGGPDSLLLSGVRNPKRHPRDLGIPPDAGSSSVLRV